MTFRYDNQYEQEKYISFQGLINKNDGFFKSVKHSKFIARHDDARRDADDMKQYFNIDMTDGQYAISVSGSTRWADYGSRSVIPSITYFVFDEYGVTAKYKIGGNGNLRDGWAPNPKKTKLVWERPADAKLPDFDFSEPKPEDDTRPALEEGRVKLTGTVKSTKFVDTQFGTTEKMVFNLDSGNTVYGTVPSSVDAERGTRLEFMARVTKSDDDPHFGFYSRPTKVIELET